MRDGRLPNGVACQAMPDACQACHAGTRCGPWHRPRRADPRVRWHIVNCSIWDSSHHCPGHDAAAWCRASRAARRAARRERFPRSVSPPATGRPVRLLSGLLGGTTGCLVAGGLAGVTVPAQTPSAILWRWDSEAYQVAHGWRQAHPAQMANAARLAAGSLCAASKVECCPRHAWPGSAGWLAMTASRPTSSPAAMSLDTAALCHYVRQQFVKQG